MSLRGPAAIGVVFQRAAQERRAVLIAYLMAGFPDEPIGIDAAHAAVKAGAAILEIGVPFSDPVADGPVIADAGRRALAVGGGLDGAIRTIQALRDRGVSAPILAMSYLNPLMATGYAAALKSLADAGADGLILPDLPADEDPAFERLAADAGLALCFLVAPNTSPARMEQAVTSSTGFLYAVPLYGVTGARDRIAKTARPLLDRASQAAAGRVPIAVGFGVRTPEHVAELAASADGVVVGSALVAALDARGPKAVGSLVRRLASGTGRVRRR